MKVQLARVALNKTLGRFKHTAMTAKSSVYVGKCTKVSGCHHGSTALSVATMKRRFLVAKRGSVTRPEQEVGINETGFKIKASCLFLLLLF